MLFETKKSNSIAHFTNIIKHFQAVLINVKEQEVDFDNMFALVLIELEENVKNISFPCVGRSNRESLL